MSKAKCAKWLHRWSIFPLFVLLLLNLIPFTAPLVMTRQACSCWTFLDSLMAITIWAAFVKSCEMNSGAKHIAAWPVSIWRTSPVKRHFQILDSVWENPATMKSFTYWLIYFTNLRWSPSTSWPTMGLCAPPGLDIKAVPLLTILSSHHLPF